MKINSYHRIARAGLLLVSSTLAGICAAQTLQTSPVGTTWDCVISGGHQRGIVVLDFFNDGSGFGGTFSGYKLTSTVISAPSTTAIEIGRGGGDIGRNGTTSSGSTNTPPPTEVTFGFTDVSGPWTYDDKGRVVGWFNETLTEGNFAWPCAQNYLVTNSAGTLSNYISFCFTSSQFMTNVAFSDGTTNTFVFTTNQVPTGTTTTNSEYFVARSVSAKRLVLKASSDQIAPQIYTGVPIKTNLVDISGHWVGYKTVASQTPQLVTFDLVYSGVDNVYLVSNGIGANFTFEGEAVVSSQRQIGFSFTTMANGSTENILGATVGSLTANSRMSKVVTKGIEAPGNSMKFNASLQHP